jgi:two-component system, OmpR family, response regulator
LTERRREAVQLSADDRNTMTAVHDHPRSVGSSSTWADHAWSEPAGARILVIDDEPQISAFVGRALRQAGYHVDIAQSASDGIDRACTGGCDLVILDLIMPDLDGRAVLSQILRVRPGQAVLVLSCSSDVSTKVECLDLGARDYLTKPFSLAELIARVRAGLRENAKRSELIRVGDLTLDAGRLVADSGAGPVALTRLEFLCLRALIDHGGGPITKSELLASVWGIDFDPGSNLVDVCIRRLRAKLGFSLIETVRGEGYRLAC